VVKLESTIKHKRNTNGHHNNSANKIQSKNESSASISKSKSESIDRRLAISDKQ